MTVLRGVRLPGDDTLLDLHLSAGVIGRIVPATGGPGLDGRWVIPGLWDEHVHATQLALAIGRLDLSSADSAAEAVSLVRGALGARDELTGIGFRDVAWPDAPTLAALDAASATVPITLISHDLHCVWINTAAASRFGVNAPADGLLREDQAFAVTRALGRLPDAVVDGWVGDVAARAAARGVVGIVDFEMSWNRDPWERRRAAGFDLLRVDLGVYAEHLERAADMRTGDAIDELLAVGPLKLLIDGSLNTRTAYCVDPYPHGEHGVLTVDPADLVAVLDHARAAGFLPAVHAIGDAANQVALDAFETVGIGGRIEHAQFLRHADLARFGRLGVTASVQPAHALDDRDAAEEHWAGRTDRAFPLRSLLDAGATLILGSDAPVAALDPWATMSAASWRARSDGRAPWHPEQSISRAEALAASTRTTVAVGQPADLVVLDADPFTVSDAAFATMPVAATLLGGRPTHGADLL